ncbi:MAG TPA: class II fumarate hydratase [Kofleriaceae bacterium]|nr:class II fumarate hydratase [Kofleriaceae bacterium]
MATRTETDSLGAVEVPAERYWGAQTQRSLENFPIGTTRMPLAIVYALAAVKRAAARVNGAAGRLDAQVADAIDRAAAEVMSGGLDENFPLVIWQTGSGTQTNMNVNEVIAGRANELLGSGRGGKKPVHPNDHVNLGMSSNDAFPTAMNVAAALALEDRVLPALHALAAALDAKARAWTDIVKLGRTHMMDATPLTVGHEASGWTAQVRAAADAIEALLPRVRALAIGGTAVGTGLNAPPGFADGVIAELSALHGRAFTAAPNRFAALASHDDLVAASGALRGAAVALTKVGNDIRLLGSGPRAGIGELVLPANEPGSSIMPGKVNPTQVEALTMVCARVIGNDAAITVGGLQGHLELNVFKPLIGACALESATLLADACDSFRLRCVDGLAVDEQRTALLVERSLMLVTALAPRIGYDAAARVAKHAHEHGLTLREAALALGVLNAQELDELLRPETMLGG